MPDDIKLSIVLRHAETGVAARKLAIISLVPDISIAFYQPGLGAVITR